MKIFTFLLLCSIIIFINALDCSEKTSASSFSDCQNLSVSDGNKCCYFNLNFEYNDVPDGLSSCSELTKDQYENIDKLKSEFTEKIKEEGGKVKSFNILCDATDTSDNSIKSYCYDKESASSSDDCKDLKVSGDGNHCCYLYVKGEYEGKTSESESCIEITKEEYDNIDDYIDKAKDNAEKYGGKYKKYEIDCNSSFLTNSLLGIILFLL